MFSVMVYYGFLLTAVSQFVARDISRGSKIQRNQICSKNPKYQLIHASFRMVYRHISEVQSSSASL